MFICSFIEMSRQRPVDLTNVIDYMDLTEPVVYDNIDVMKNQRTAIERLERQVESLLHVWLDGEDPKAKILRLASLPLDVVAKILSYESDAWNEKCWRHFCY